MTSLEKTVNSYRYISFAQLKRLLSLTYADSTLKNLRRQIRADLKADLYRAEGIERPRGDWILISHQAKGKELGHALAITEELIDFETWAKESGYKISFELTPKIGKIIPDAEVLLQLEDRFSLIYLEVEYSDNRPKLEKYIEAQHDIKERAKHKLGKGKEPKDFHFHLEVVDV